MFRVRVNESTVLSPRLKVLIRLVCGIDGGAIVVGANVMESSIVNKLIIH